MDLVEEWKKLRPPFLHKKFVYNCKVLSIKVYTPCNVLSIFKIYGNQLTNGDTDSRLVQEAGAACFTRCSHKAFRTVGALAEFPPDTTAGFPRTFHTLHAASTDIHCLTILAIQRLRAAVSWVARWRTSERGYWRMAVQEECSYKGEVFCKL